ncbi:glucose sorbosone dehydrogenase [Candidatus Wolfebacteria bacterium]|nr:MAG: glucose sorbosone dehydrogenase [Candidatus Wolfebacteria bacterium]
MKKIYIKLIVYTVVVVGLFFVFRSVIMQTLYSPTQTTLEQGVQIEKEFIPFDSGAQIDIEEPIDSVTAPGETPAQTTSVIKVEEEIPAIEVVAQNLSIPWEVVFVPGSSGNISDYDLLITERTGNLLLIGDDNEVFTIQGVEHVGEGGLLGLALHPSFKENGYIYLYLTTKEDEGLLNRVERYVLDGDSLLNRKIIIDSIPGAIFHDGGRIKFGPDGFLYITTGDARVASNAQDINSLAGKILRIRDDGRIPEDNPFGTAVYSYGHRNPQGLAWDSGGTLWITEHGPSGTQSGFDELNLVVKGNNYGWPIIKGDETQIGLNSPVVHSGPNETWAPAGALFVPVRQSLDGEGNESLFFAGLRGESLYEAKIKDNEVRSLTAHFREEFGRIRAVALSPDGFLFISTSNTDGRGNARSGDDKIIKINPIIF